MPGQRPDLGMLDKTFHNRAKELARDAERGASRTHATVALKQWWHDGEWKQFAVDTGIGLGANVGLAAAGAAITAAGVAAAAVTFGIAPVAAMAVGFAIRKGLGEYRYQRSSNDLRRAIQAKRRPGLGDTFDLDQLPNAFSKVLKKYVRVMRRAKQLLGGARGAAYNARHLVTTIRAQFKKNYAGTKLSTEFPDDGELNERLLELRYYGQMTFNVLDELLKNYVDRRAAHVQFANHAYAHIVRQVHFTGNHDHCSLFRCYTLSQDEFRRNLLAIRPAPAAVGLQRLVPDAIRNRQYASQQRAQVGSTMAGNEATFSPTPPLKGLDLAHLRGKMHATAPEQLAGGAAELAKELAGDFGKEYSASAAGDVGGAYSIRNPASVTEQLKNSLLSSPENVAGAVARNFETLNEAGATAGSAGFGKGLDIALGFVTERWQRHKTRKRVLGCQEAVVNLLRDGEQQAAKELKLLMEGDDKKHAPRTIQKIEWYLEKIDALESDLGFRQVQHKVANAGFQHSVFDHCGQAYDLWHAIHYLMRQYDKLITNIIFLQAILVQLDRKVAAIKVGVALGSIIAENTRTPVRPPHMKDID